MARDDIMDGITLKQLTKIDMFDPVRTWGGAPLLIVKAPAEDGHAPLLFATPSPEDSNIDTCALMIGAEKLNNYVSPGAVVVPLVKKGHRNPFAGMIYVGRAYNNDVLLSDERVSKCHCWFIPPSSAGGLWKLMDNGSTNGTCVNNLALEQGSMGHVRPGDEIRIGTVETVFIDAEMLPMVLDYASEAWQRAPTVATRFEDTESLSRYIRDRVEDNEPVGLDNSSDSNESEGSKSASDSHLDLVSAD